MSIMWARATATGVIFGVIGGCVAGMTCWLTYASTYEGGLSLATFARNTGEELPMLVGNKLKNVPVCAALFFSFFLWLYECITDMVIIKISNFKLLILYPVNEGFTDESVTYLT